MREIVLHEVVVVEESIGDTVCLCLSATGTNEDKNAIQVAMRILQWSSATSTLTSTLCSAKSSYNAQPQKYLKILLFEVRISLHL